jgi:hypothetical protein
LFQILNLTYNTSVAYHSLMGDYSLQALEEIFSDLLTLYGGVCLLEDFNVDLLDSGHSLFTRFLEMFMLYNVVFFGREERLASFWIYYWSPILIMWVIFIRLLSHGVTMI